MKENLVHLFATILFVVVMFVCKEVIEIGIYKSMLVAFIIVLIIEILISMKK